MNFFDANRFQGTAYYYSQYRLSYPSSFFDYLASEFEISKADRLLDLGCGTGQITIPFSKYFAETIGADPNKEMLDQAMLVAKQQGAKNIVWLIAASHLLMEHKSLLDQLKLVTIGNAFHWMQGAETLQILYDLVSHDGGVVIVANDTGAYDNDENWGQVALSIIEYWLGDKRRSGAGYYTPPTKSISQELIESPFLYHGKPYMYQYEIDLSIDQIIGLLYSKSYCSPLALGEKQAGFEQHLRQELERLNPAKVFKNTITLKAYIGYKK